MAPEVPPVPPHRRPEKRWTGKPTGRWVIARKVIQYLSLLIFAGLFILARRSGDSNAGLTGSNLVMRLDPLLMASHLLASRTFLAGSAMALLVVILTLVFGRAWCGWLCPLGTTLDLLSPPTNLRAAFPRQPEGWRSIKYGLLLTILVAALFGNLTLLALDPLAILFRTLATSIWPALDQMVTAIETALYRVSFMAGPVSSFDAWIRPRVLPSEPVFYREAVIFAASFSGVVLLSWAAPRFWCRYLCPLGGLLGMLSKLALFRRLVSPVCKGCTLCTQVCPTGTVNPNKGYASDPSECTMCLDCLEVCPRSTIRFTPGLSLAQWQDYDPGRRQALAALGTSALAIALFRSDALAKRESPYLLRPPGGRENELLDRCVRCAACVRACPTSAIQPALSEAGLEGLWTPVIIPRLGYCDYACNACGQVCPVQAIPPLELEEKRSQIIGKAYIDQNRCIAWSDQKPCIVCEEMCPLPEKAVRLQDSTVTVEDGSIVLLQLPSVIRDRCIGCGICEYKCPVNGEAAIRVYVPGTEALF